MRAGAAPCPAAPRLAARDRRPRYRAPRRRRAASLPPAALAAFDEARPVRPWLDQVLPPAHLPPPRPGMSTFQTISRASPGAVRKQPHLQSDQLIRGWSRCSDPVRSPMSLSIGRRRASPCAPMSDRCAWMPLALSAKFRDAYRHFDLLKWPAFLLQKETPTTCCPPARMFDGRGTSASTCVRRRRAAPFSVRRAAADPAADEPAIFRPKRRALRIISHFPSRRRARHGAATVNRWKVPVVRKPLRTTRNGSGGACIWRTDR